MSLSIDDRLVYGDAILERLTGSLDASIKADHASFKKQHTAFRAAFASVAAAEKVYLQALSAVASLDTTRDKTVSAIADEMPAAKLGTRAKPFGDFTPHSPSRLKSLPYAAETREVESFLSALTAANPPAAIAKLCSRLSTENTAVDTALTALSKPLSTLNEARAARDLVVPDWDKSLRHLKDSARVAFRASPGRFDAVFASPLAVQTNTRPRRRAAQSAAPAPAGEGQSTPAAPTKTKKRARRK